VTTRLPSPRRTTRFALAVVLASVALASCDEKLSDVTGPTPDLNPTFSSIQAQILESTDSAGRAACINCHRPGGAGGFILVLLGPVAYNNLVNVSSRERPGTMLVKPGDPDNSYLIQKLEGRAGIQGGRMPLSGPPYLTDGQIQVIRRWIQQGANNN